MANNNNPRFPHTCRILRAPDTDPMEDQPVPVVVDDNPMVDDPMTDEPEQQPVDTQQENAPVEGDADDEKKDTVVYEGVCRGYNRDTTSDNGDVNASYRYLALPQKQDEWTDENVPRVGDRVELNRFGYTEYGDIIDVRPGNLGTHIQWKYVRN